ncbi:hypothetical protein Tco_1028860 [Tanacetum coccineum]|uniref:Uncharacterized protein n=1 Tax=Tanacetum coccineum TaxID=301880 RepID=A0ABQ5G3E7_9ASTR
MLLRTFFYVAIQLLFTLVLCMLFTLYGLIRWLSPLPLETEVKGSILTPCKAGDPFLPLVEPEATSLPLVWVWPSTSQPSPYTMEEGIGNHNMWKTVLGVTFPYLTFYIYDSLDQAVRDLKSCNLIAIEM